MGVNRKVGPHNLIENLRPGTSLDTIHMKDSINPSGTSWARGYTVTDEFEGIMQVEHIVVCQEPGPMGYTPWALVKFTEAQRKRLGVGYTYVNLMQAEQVTFVDRS